MRIYRVFTEDYGYDDYYEVVVRARDPDEARKLAKQRIVSDDIYVREVQIEGPAEIISECFNAG